jgi:hypothetical protein
VQPLWKKIWRLLQNLYIDLAYDPAIKPLGIYPKECHTGYLRGTCTAMFIAALFTIAQIWEQPKCPITGKQKLKKNLNNKTTSFHCLQVEKNVCVYVYAHKY